MTFIITIIALLVLSAVSMLIVIPYYDKKTRRYFNLRYYLHWICLIIYLITGTIFIYNILPRIIK